MDRIDIPEWNFTGGPLQERDVKIASGALDFPSIAAAASATLTIALPGVAVGDAVVVSSAAAAGPPAGLVFTAWVSAADTVTLRATNVTAAPVDAASGTYAAQVLKV